MSAGTNGAASDTDDAVSGGRKPDALGTAQKTSSREHTPKSSAPKWRDVLPIHPAAELFPLMSPDELLALGEDIKKRGLVVPIVLSSERPPRLVDGRGRLDGMEAVGLQVLHGRNLNRDLVIATSLESKVDPFEFVISVNIRRRHLSIEDKDRLIVQLLKANPTKSNRAVAKLTDTSHPHVAKVRERAARTGDVETVSTSIDTKGRKQPVKRAKPRTKPVAPAKTVAPASEQEQVNGFIHKILDFTFNNYVPAVRAWREAHLALDDEAKDAWMKALYDVAQELNLLAQELDGR